ncbi:MAG: M23 family metallopeptidase, partial [Firmicutes bacterium]|nr:M23 family metallopeptidase [Bacillota bacterium]
MPGRTYSFRDRRWRYSRFRLAGISYGGFIDLLWRPGLIRKISVSLAIFMLVFVARTIDTPVRGPLDRYLEVLLVPGKESAAGSAWAKITANLKPRSLLAGLLGVDLEALSGQAQEAGSYLIGQPGETGSSPQPSGQSPVQVSPAPELALPVIGQLSSGFGPRMNPVNGKPEFHTGLDLAAPDGTPVRSVLPGTVTEVVEDDRWGR